MPDGITRNVIGLIAVIWIFSFIRAAVEVFAIDDCKIISLFSSLMDLIPYAIVFFIYATMTTRLLALGLRPSLVPV